MSQIHEAQPGQGYLPTPKELFGLDRPGATGLNSIASQALRNRRTEGSFTPAELAKSLGQDAPAFSGEVDLFAPAKPRAAAVELTIVRDNILPEQAVPAFSGAAGISLEADTVTLASDTTSTPHESVTVKRQRRQTGRASAASGVLLAATLVGGSGIVVLAQEGSPIPSVDPLTGVVDPCASPTPEPSESIIPDRTLPPDIGQISGGAVVAQGINANGETVIVKLSAQEAPSAAPSIGELFPSLSPAPTDPLTGAVICPSPIPSTEPSVSAKSSTPPSAPPSAEASPTPSGPAPDSVKALLESDIDPKAKIADVLSAIDTMYKNRDFKASLARLTSFYSETTRIRKKIIVDYLKECRDEKAPSSRNIICVGNIINIITYAQQYPLDSGNPIDSAINSAFVNAANMLRSAMVNDGTPVKELDKDIASDAKQLGLL